MIIMKALKWLYRINKADKPDLHLVQLIRNRHYIDTPNINNFEIAQVWQKQHQIKVDVIESSIFSDIIGYENIKKILQTMLDSTTPISILLDGSAGCGKSMFLKDIERHYRYQTYYIDGSRATKAGIFNVLFEDENNQIRYLLIDEIDKLNISDQESLLTLIEDGRLIQVQKNGTMSKKYDNLSVIAASNDKNSILYPLQTRFYKIAIKDYTIDQFKEISRKVLQQYNLSQEVQEYIILRILETKKKPNIRDVKQIAKLCNNDKNMVDLLIESSG